MIQYKDNHRTAIITWINYYNFGTFLQAYALQKAIETLGYPNKVIDDIRYIDLRKPSIKWQLIHLCVNILHPRRVFMNNLLQSRRFKKFAKQNINIDHDWTSTSELTKHYDTFVCGSDQIWSTYAKDFHDGFYYASFVEDKNKLLAYAPSLGAKANYSRIFADTVKPWLDKFEVLAIRETSGAEIVRNITGRDDIHTVLDPTLLLSRIQWLEFVKSNKGKYKPIKESYMLAYFLTYNEKYLARAYQLAHSRGMKLVCLNTCKVSKKFADKIVIGTGPVEFLNLVADAEAVFTDSFHGTIFAMHFHKPFITFKRFSNSDSTNQNSRIENLFQIVGISDNFLDENTLYSMPGNPDWKNIEQNLNSRRMESIQILKNGLD